MAPTVAQGGSMTFRHRRGRALLVGSTVMVRRHTRRRRDSLPVVVDRTTTTIITVNAINNIMEAAIEVTTETAGRTTGTEGIPIDNRRRVDDVTIEGVTGGTIATDLVGIGMAWIGTAGDGEEEEPRMASITEEEEAETGEVQIDTGRSVAVVVLEIENHGAINTTSSSSSEEVAVGTTKKMCTRHLVVEARETPPSRMMDSCPLVIGATAVAGGIVVVEEEEEPVEDRGETLENDDISNGNAVR